MPPCTSLRRSLGGEGKDTVATIDVERNDIGMTRKAVLLNKYQYLVSKLNNRAQR